MLTFPLPSSYFQCTVNVPCVLYEVGSVVVPVIVPEQLSVAFGAVTDALHSPVALVSVATSGTGAVTSFTITVWFCCLRFHDRHHNPSVQ